MEEAYEILDYLPVKFKNHDEQEYIEFLWGSFEDNYENEKYQFSFIAYHMLFMSFVYFNVWQIKSVRKDDFEMLRLGFYKDFGDITSPFMFSGEGEIKIFTLLKYLCASHTDVNALIGRYKNLVKERNNVAHASGNLPFRTVTYLETRVNDMVRYASEIQSFSKPIIEECFENFLIESQDEEERQYIDILEQINEVLIHEHYLSKKDIEFCLAYNITQLSGEPYYAEIERIFEHLKEEYVLEEI